MAPVVVSTTSVSDTRGVGARLTIVFDGTSPGLAEDSLSLSAFGGALQYLPTALQQIAKDLWRDAASGPRRGPVGRAGRFLDVRIKSVTFSSPATIYSHVELAPNLPPAAVLFADEILEAATVRLITDLEREASGKPGHWAARLLLAKLPSGLTQQSYEAVAADGRLLARAQIGSRETSPTAPQTLPFLDDVSGSVVGVISEDRRHRIELRAEGRLHKLEATAEQCRLALDFMRSGETATARIVDIGGHSRLLLFVSEQVGMASESDRLAHIHSRWSGLLERLAR